MAAGKITSNRHRNGPRHRRHRSCPRYGHGWKRARSYASRATISSDIRRKSPMVRVLQHQDRRSIAILSGSRRASSFWLTTVPHAPKSSRRTSPKRPGGPIATCRRPRHLLSPKAQAQGNDGPALGFLGNKGAPLLGDRAPAVFPSAVDHCPHRSRDALPHIPPGPPNSTIRSGHSIRRCHHLRTPRWNRCRRNAPHELRQHDQVENPHILFGPEPVGANHDPGIEFAPDSQKAIRSLVDGKGRGASITGRSREGLTTSRKSGSV